MSGLYDGDRGLSARQADMTELEAINGYQMPVGRAAIKRVVDGLQIKYEKYVTTSYKNWAEIRAEAGAFAASITPASKGTEGTKEDYDRLSATLRMCKAFGRGGR